MIDELYKIFRKDPISHVTEDEKYTLLDNRRYFVEQHGVISEAAKGPHLYELQNINMFGLNLDHMRTYKCLFGKLVFVCSNYGTRPPAILGMTQIDYIYHPRAMSFYREFSYTRQLNAFVKALLALHKCGQLEPIVKALEANA